MKVKLVTTWQIPCGIAEHSAQLVDAVEDADPTIIHAPIIDLHPRAILEGPGDYDLLVLNYHAALHSQWTPAHIEAAKARTPVLVIYHDTGVPNSEQCRTVCAAASYFVVHEPYDDLPAHGEYLRMGVGDWARPWMFDRSPTSWCGLRPVLGSIGFPFGWKNFDRLAEITGDLGWALMLIAPDATPAQLEQWREANPALSVTTRFLPRAEAVARLAACDATAFVYVCHNTGQSAAILNGIAARKPVLALETCRQFRALRADPLGAEAIDWTRDFTEMTQLMGQMAIGTRCDPAIVALAEQESWTRRGQRYAALYAALTA